MLLAFSVLECIASFEFTTKSIFYNDIMPPKSFDNLKNLDKKSARAISSVEVSSCEARQFLPINSPECGLRMFIQPATSKGKARKKVLLGQSFFALLFSCLAVFTPVHYEMAVVYRSASRRLFVYQRLIQQCHPPDPSFFTKSTSGPLR